jgi:NADH:ubiquinone oxidoreductase subunit 6 (subunit J)
VPFGASILVLLLLTLIGAAGTLSTFLFTGLRVLRSYAWRMWLWGSLGLIVANLALIAILVPIFGRTGVPHGSVPFGDNRTEALTDLLVFGPLVASTIGLLAGTGLGFRLAARPSA